MNRRLILLMLVALGLMGCSQPRPILILAATPQEIWPLLAHVTDQQEIQLYNQPISNGSALTGTLDGQYVALMVTGVGMVEAASTTQRGIDAFRPTKILMLGVAGALSPSLDLGTVVIPTGWVNHQYGVISERGFSPVPIESRPYNAASQLLDVAKTLPDVVVEGYGISGDVFVNDATARDRLYSLFMAQVVDMESAAVAQTASKNHTPFLIIRAVSDRAGGEAEGEIAQNVNEAILAACDTLRAIIQGL